MPAKWLAAATAAAALLTFASAAPAAVGLSGKYGRTVTGAGKKLDGRWVIDFTSGGRYTVAVDRHVIGKGTDVVKGNKVTLHDSACKLAQRGGYTFRLEGAILTFKRISDPCAGRSIVLAKPLHHEM